MKKTLLIIMVMLSSFSLKSQIIKPKFDFNYFFQKLDSTNRVLFEANSWIGVKYRWGGVSRTGVDCSAFVKNVFKTIDLDLPRTSKEQYRNTKSINKRELQIGDLVFFLNSKGVHHVGIIYEVNGTNIKFIHSASSKGVSISPLNSGYWANKTQKYSRIMI